MNNEIYDSIKKRILFFEYKPGAILNEKALAAEFKVSRTPVREVLLRLEWENLINIVPRAGIMVSGIEFRELRDVFESRIPLEGLVGRLVATHIDDAGITELEAIIERCQTIDANEDRKGVIAIDLDYRAFLGKYTKNNRLREVSDYLYFQTQRLWFLYFDQTSWETVLEEEKKEIIEMYEILKKRDADQAEQARKNIMIYHMERISKILNLS